MNIEILGFILANIYDSVAITKTLAWVETNVGNNLAVTENNVIEKLTQFKQVLPGYVSHSFATISSSGSNSAMSHFKGSDNNN